MITLDILEQRLLPSPYFDACLVCLFSIIINPIFICPIKTLRVSITLINRFGDDRKKNIPNMHRSMEIEAGVVLIYLK